MRRRAVSFWKLRSVREQKKRRRRRLAGLALTAAACAASVLSEEKALDLPGLLSGKAVCPGLYDERIEASRNVTDSVRGIFDGAAGVFLKDGSLVFFYLDREQEVCGNAGQDSQ